MMFYSNHSECVEYHIVPSSAQYNMHYAYSIIIEVREQKLHRIITKHLTRFNEFSCLKN